MRRSWGNLPVSPDPFHNPLRGQRYALDQKNSPSRLRFRPLSRLTIRLRVLPSDSASTYLRSVLGASGNLEDRARGFKRGDERNPRNLRPSRLDVAQLDITLISVC